MAYRDSDLLTTSAAATLAGVGTTSVKRWADQGLLAFTKTAGGHRRFPRSTFERFLQQQHGNRQPQHGKPHAAATHDIASPEVSEWIGRLLDGRAHELDAALLSARGRLGAWHAVADALAPVIVELGLRWERGAITIFEEHLASERLARALARATDAMPAPLDGPRCLLACAEGDEHTLGLSLVELCLRAAGWLPLWAGRRMPLAEIVRIVRAGDVAMLAVSASAASSGAASLARQLTQIDAACQATGTKLVLGGAGAWPKTLAHGVHFEGFGVLHRHAVEQLAHAHRRVRVA